MLEFFKMNVTKVVAVFAIIFLLQMDNISSQTKATGLGCNFARCTKEYRLIGGRIVLVCVDIMFNVVVCERKREVIEGPLSKVLYFTFISST